MTMNNNQHSFESIKTFPKAIFMEKVYNDPNYHTQYVIWQGACHETPPILMNEILVEEVVFCKAQW